MMTQPAGNNDPPSSNSINGSNGDGSWRIEPMPPDLIDSPLDFIFAEHLRQREAATILTLISDGEFEGICLDELIDFFNEDFLLHISDEEVALFPILLQRCLPEDKMENVIHRLQEEHRQDEDSVEDVIATLVRLRERKFLTVEEARRLRRFAEHIRQHLALENGVLLPIARVRLEAEDLRVLAQLLKRRRA